MKRDRVTGMPFSTFEFFQAVTDAFDGKIAANVPQRRTKPRASSLLDDARVIAYSMANTPKSNPAREDPDHVDLAYTQETGRVTEAITIAGLEQLGYPVFGAQTCIGHEACEEGAATGNVDHWATGHPDGMVNLGHLDEEGRPAYALVSFKHLNRFPFGHLWQDGIHKRLDAKGRHTKGMELFAQEAVYGSGMLYPPAEVWWFVIAQDASSMRLEFKWKVYEGKNAHPKGFLRAVEWDDIDYLIPTLRARAEWFTNWLENDGDPAHVAMEKPIPKNWRDLAPADAFPWGYTQYEDRALADGQGHLIAPRPLPF